MDWRLGKPRVKDFGRWQVIDVALNYSINFLSREITRTATKPLIRGCRISKDRIH